MKINDIKRVETPIVGGGRNDVLDSAKCHLIFLVVFGHVLYLSDSYYDDRLIKAFISWIWFFHMPAFTLISGYFFKSNQPVKKLLISSSKLIVTYVIMQISMSIIYGPRDIVSILLIPQYAMWYLLALVVWRIFAYLGIKITNNLVLLLSLSVIISMGAGFIPFSYLGFQRTCSFLPFFFLGMIMNRYNIIPFIRKYGKYGILILIVLLVAFIVPYRAICSGMCNAPYKSLIQLFTRFSVLILGTIMSLSFIGSIPVRKTLSSIGKRTLFIYCYHVFFIFQVIPQLWMKLGINPNFLIVTIYSLLVFGVLALLSKIKILNFLINPLGKY